MQIGENENNRMQFVRGCISEYKSSDDYKTAITAEKYDKHRNATIEQYQKLLYTISGRAVPDNYSANFKIKSNFFHTFIEQEIQFLLGNGVSWGNENVETKIGNDFDHKLVQLTKAALVGGVGYGFYNLDHVEIFKATEFVPLYDEENGALMAGIRFWQVSPNKPLRATLYEIDGYTDYIWNTKNVSAKVLNEKRAYKLKYKISQVDGLRIYDGENYESFPIIPMFANEYKQSRLVGLREQIDCYDLIKSGFANDVDDASQIYWTIQNAGGMDDVDLAQFVERMKTVRAAVVSDDGARAESHTVEVPYSSREALLNRLEKDLYRDAQALDITNIANGSITATQIKAAYEPLESLCDGLEYQVLSFIDKLLKIAQTENTATFTRSKLVNTTEEIQTIAAAATYLSEDYVTEKIMTILGDGDRVSDVLDKMTEDEAKRFGNGDTSTTEE
jgi:SPP1 family phage portal protein